MRRLKLISRSRSVGHAFFSTMEKMENEQKAREAAVDARHVVFSSATSDDMRPRVAAQEAFDLAASALPRPPTLCILNVSLDLETMMDVPEAVWGRLHKTSNGKGRMIGHAVNKQRFRGGFVQVILGTVPDLECDIFTLDSIPTADFLNRSSAPPAAAGFCTIDAGLAIHHEPVIVEHLQTLQRSIPHAPVVGGVLQGVGRDAGDSLAFFDDRVFKGSAACCILRSDLLKVTSVSTVPSISVGSGSITRCSSSGDMTHIFEIDSVAATDFIANAYRANLENNDVSKIFLGVERAGSVIPISFTGDTVERCLSVRVPPGLKLTEGDTVRLVCDEPGLDIEATAGVLLQHTEKMEFKAVEKTMNVSREGRRFITVSSGCAIHYSSGSHNQVAHRDDVVTLGGGAPLFLPPVVTRCLGHQCATGGIYCPAQIVDLGGQPFISPRSSVNVVMTGLK